MAKNKSPYAKRRVKVKKPDPTANPFDKELKDTRNKRFIGIVIGLIILVMVGTMILPYLGSSTGSNYTLPEDVLKADEKETNANYLAKNIVLGQTFNRSEKEYFVVFGATGNTTSYENKLASKSVYFVNADEGVNKALKIDVSKGSKLPKNPSQIKIKDRVAIIKIKNGKAVKFYNTKKLVDSYVKTIK